MCEAFYALRRGLSFFATAQQEDEDVAHHSYTAAGTDCRYAFLLAANALEAAANALLLGLDTGRSSYSDMEKLPTLLKFEIFCLAKGKRIDRSNDLYGRVKDVVRCRNEFVHPKPTDALVELTANGSDVEVKVAKTRTRGYPMSFCMFEPTHAREAIGDILAFVAWVVFDICKFEMKDGALIIGHQSCGSTGSISLVGSEIWIRP